MAESWPDHSAELGRKAMERIAADVQRYEDGEITESELWDTADVLSEVCQGLIDNETWNTIYAVRQEMAKKLKAAGIHR
ncbi:hypothetical protein IVB12_15630 [Bradyrhizobium sp. 179]|uniref:hypothetical protein n=1 Tax=Bradyrhizobium sp. 179 TaxID=2782648 RepID=UPI001FF75008|nr:hypothetical protein [Bradyrhizobium sp. 179]MCK1543346.1 hypothetical protein [Bradyrhizobium sp. 179]